MPKSLGLSKEQTRKRRNEQAKIRNSTPEGKARLKATAARCLANDPEYNSRRSKKWKEKQPREYFEAYSILAKPLKRREYLEHRDERLRYALEWANANPEKRIAAVSKYNYKIRKLPTPTRPKPKLCEICHKPETRLNKLGEPISLALDHCHNKGHFRGWLCFRCNATIGRAEDDVELLQAMIDYIKNDLANQANLESLKEVA